MLGNRAVSSRRSLSLRAQRWARFDASLRRPAPVVSSTPGVTLVRALRPRRRRWQNLPVLDRSSGGYASAAGVGRGAYVLAAAGDALATIIATGSEVWVAVAAVQKLEFPVRIVSMPSWELFEQQDDHYRASVLPRNLPTLAVEAGIAMGWERYADDVVSIERFGASAPGQTVLEKLGISPGNVADHLRRLLDV